MEIKFWLVFVAALSLSACASDPRPRWLKNLDKEPDTAPMLTAQFCIKAAGERVLILTHSTYGHGSGLTTELAKSAAGTRFIEVYGSKHFESFAVSRFKDGKSGGVTQVFLPPPAVSADRWTAWRSPDYQSASDMYDYLVSNRRPVALQASEDTEIKVRYTLMSFSEYLSHIRIKRDQQLPKTDGDCDFGWNRVQQ